jgi:hypothetical protein
LIVFPCLPVLFDCLKDVSDGNTNSVLIVFSTGTLNEGYNLPSLTNQFSLSLLAWEYSLSGFLSEKRWSFESSSRRLTVLSIQPKDRASSTASLYCMRGLPELLADID